MLVKHIKKVGDHMRQAALRAVTLLPAAVVDDDDEREYWTMTVPWGCLITRDEERSAEHVCIHLMTCLILINLRCRSISHEYTLEYISNGTKQELSNQDNHPLHPLLMTSLPLALTSTI